MRLNNLKKRILRKIKFNDLRNKSKKLNLVYKILVSKKLNLFDIGAGQRILPEFMNFDGISKTRISIIHTTNLRNILKIMKIFLSFRQQYQIKL